MHNAWFEYFFPVLFLFSSNQSIITSGVSVTTTSSTLTFPSITQNDENVYSCLASTLNGGSVTDSIQINVIGKSSFFA